VHLLRFVVLALVLLTATACESYKPVIEANKDSAYQQKLTRVLLPRTSLPMALWRHRPSRLHDFRKPSPTSGRLWA
jgi:hypothetical protein